MHKPWECRAWSISAAQLIKDDKFVAVIDFNPNGSGYLYDREIAFILDALNEKEQRNRARDETA